MFIFDWMVRCSIWVWSQSTHILKFEFGKIWILIWVTVMYVNLFWASDQLWVHIQYIFMPIYLYADVKYRSKWDKKKDIKWENKPEAKQIKYNKINRIGRMHFYSIRELLYLEILSYTKFVALTFITSFVVALNVGVLSTDFAKKCRERHF